MMFERDIHQTRVKNSSLCVRYFSVQARAIHFIYFLLERACQDAGHHGHKSRKNEKSLFFKQLITEIIKVFSHKGGFG
jgi:hypothetical protein